MSVIFECRVKNVVVRGVNYVIQPFSLNEGDFGAIYGGSGSGVQELLELFAGLATAGTETENPAPGRLKRTIKRIDTSGFQTILLHGQPLYEMDPRDRTKKIGFVFSNPEVSILGRTVEEDYFHSLAASKLPLDQGFDIRRLTKYGLGHKIGQSTRLLSGGEMHRLNCATAIDRKPSLIVADFTNSNLDTEFLSDFLIWTGDLCKAGSAAMIAGLPPCRLASVANRNFVVQSRCLEETNTLGAEFPTVEIEKEALTKLLLPRQKGGKRVLVVRRLRRKGLTASASLELHENEIRLLTGPNGSGKTTLANILVGRVRTKDTEGTHELTDGTYPMLALQFAERGFLGGPIMNELPEENLRLACGVPPSLAAEHPLILPGAGRKLVSVASTLRLARGLAILDEPTCGMDFAAKKRFVGILNQFPKLGILIITHDDALLGLGPISEMEAQK